MVEYPITDRLRCNYNGRDFSGPVPSGTMLPTAIMKEAADEIERLIAAAKQSRHDGRMEALNAVFQINGPSRAITRLKEKYAAEMK